MDGAKFTIPKLNGTNWQSWKLRLEMLLCREDLWDVVVEQLPAVAGRTAEWKSNDRKAKATIILLLEDSQLSLVRNCVHARDAYEALRKYHEKTTRSVRVSLLKRICATNLSEGGDVEKHLRDFDELFDRLDAATMKLDKDTKICMLLRSLPPSYDGLVTALDSRSDDDISLDVVKSKLVDEYNRQLERNGGVMQQEKALRTAVGKPYREKRTCFYCKRPGHIKVDCREFLAKLEEEKSEKMQARGRENAKTVQDDRRNVCFAVTEGKATSWMIDSGASYHMTNDRKFFGSFRRIAGRSITMADGKEVPIAGEGSGVVYGVDGTGEVMRIEMQNVKFVPGLATNLISVGKLAEKNLHVVFGKDGCEIVNSKREVVATGGRSGRVYCLRIAKAARAVPVGQPRTDSQQKWRRSEGHRKEEDTDRIASQEEFVEFTFARSKKPEEEEAKEENKPKKEKEKMENEDKETNGKSEKPKEQAEGGETEEAAGGEAWDSDVLEVRRSQRPNQGVLPQYLQDYDTENAKGYMAFAAEGKRTKRRRRRRSGGARRRCR